MEFTAKTAYTLDHIKTAVADNYGVQIDTYRAEVLGSGLENACTINTALNGCLGMTILRLAAASAYVKAQTLLGSVRDQMENFDLEEHLTEDRFEEVLEEDHYNIEILGYSYTPREVLENAGDWDQALQDWRYDFDKTDLQEYVDLEDEEATREAECDHAQELLAIVVQCEWVPASDCTNLAHAILDNRGLMSKAEIEITSRLERAEHRAHRRAAADIAAGGHLADVSSDQTLDLANVSDDQKTAQTGAEEVSEPVIKLQGFGGNDNA